MIIFLSLLGKLVSVLSQITNLGAGGTWPGEIALRLKPDVLQTYSSDLQKGCILVVGTNGKTTTTLMIKKILENEGLKVLHNESGANLLNGVVSTFVQNANLRGKVEADFGVFEIDENSLPGILRFITPKVIVVLNLFRDQLDRYGEVDVIAEKWSNVLAKLPEETKIVLNADDPQVAYLGKNLKAKVTYFGVDNPKLYLKEKDHATDSIFCLNCTARLSFKGVYYAHIGIWKCEKCGYKRPIPEVTRCDDILPGLYNKYNTLAAVSVAKTLGIKEGQIKKALLDFAPAFGRQEEFIVSGKKVKIFLSKNPAGFNESLRTVISLKAKEILFVLNDRIPDGRDVSWIWDVDFEMLPENVSVTVSGERVCDVALRIKYANLSKFQIEPDLEKALRSSIKNIPTSETLYILPTYSAMLEVRKTLKGRKIL